MVGESMFPREILKSDVREKRPNPDSARVGLYPLLVEIVKQGAYLFGCTS